MKTNAAYFKKTGGPDVIEWGEISLPDPLPTDVKVKVEAVVLNSIDTYIRSGKYKPPVPLPNPYIVGRDLVGVVESAGPEANGFQKGQKVWCNSAGLNGSQGCFAEYVSIDHRLLYPVPPKVDSQDLAAALHAGATACRGLINAAMLQANEIIFVNGAGGSVGSAVIQFAVARGARVIAATSGKEKIAWCKSLGADLVVDYKGNDIASEVKKFAPNGVNVFWDTSKTPHFDLAVSILQPRGRFVLMAGAEARPEFPVGPFYRNECTLRGFNLNLASKEELAGYAQIINRCVAEGKLKTKIAKVMPLSKTAEAHKMMEQQSDIWGKIILTP